MNLETNGEPEKPAELSGKVRRFLDDPKITAKIRELYEQTRISLTGPKGGGNESHLESLKDLREQEKYEKGAEREWLSKLPREKQEALFRIMFLLGSLKGLVADYGEILEAEGAEDPKEAFKVEIINETFGNLGLEDLREEPIDNSLIQLLAVHYSKIRKYIVGAKNLGKKYGKKQLLIHISTTIKIFNSLIADAAETDAETYKKSLNGLKELRRKLEESEKNVGVEELEELENCYLRIAELRTVIPNESVTVGRSYADKLSPDAMEIKKRSIIGDVTREASTPEEVRAKGVFLQDSYVGDKMTISMGGEDILTEVLSADLLEYIPKDIPSDMRMEFRKELKALMVGISRVLMVFGIIKGINGYDIDSYKNLQVALLYGLKREMEKLRETLQKEWTKNVIVKLEPASEEIEMITYEMRVRQSEVLRQSKKEGEKDAAEILRERKESARFALEMTLGEILDRLEGLLKVIGEKEYTYHPGREIEHFCETGTNKFRRTAQMIAGVFNGDPDLTEMFPKVKADIEEAVRLRKDLYAFYRESANVEKNIQRKVKNFPQEREIKDPRQENMDRFLKNLKWAEYDKYIGEFGQVIEEYADLVSRMRPGDREIVINMQMKIDEYLEEKGKGKKGREKIARDIHSFVLAIQQIATHELNKRELLRHEDKKHLDNAIENIFMSKWGLENREISREALLKVIFRMAEANNELKEVFYRNPKLMINIQKGLNKIAEALLSIFIESIQGMVTEEEWGEERKKKIIPGERGFSKIIELLSKAEDRLEITRELL